MNAWRYTSTSPQTFMARYLIVVSYISINSYNPLQFRTAVSSILALMRLAGVTPRHLSEWGRIYAQCLDLSLSEGLASECVWLRVMFRNCCNLDSCFLPGWPSVQSEQEAHNILPNPRAVHMGFVVDKVAQGQVFLLVLRFSPVSIIPPLLHIHSCIIWEMDRGPVSGRSATETWLLETGTGLRKRRVVSWVDLG
jgi:hypothetical protein